MAKLIFSLLLVLPHPRGAAGDYRGSELARERERDGAAGERLERGEEC